MADISNNLLQAISTVVQSEVSKLTFDKTVEASISSLLDATEGKYLVNYEGSSFAAYSNDTSVVYEAGDLVFLKIPEGDTTKRKTIEGKVSSIISYKEKIALTSLDSPVGPAFDKIFDYDPNDEFGLIAGSQVYSKTIYDFDEEDDPSRLKELFRDLSDTYSKIKITADFLTNFKGAPSKGNYGLRFIFKANDYNDSGELTSKEIGFALDLPSFTGSPYNYTSYATQQIGLNVQTEYLQNLQRIEFFQEDFDYDTWQELRQKSDGTWETYDVSNETINNIFVKNIYMQFVEEVDLSDDLYHAIISTPDGTYLDEDSLTLTAKLFYAGQNVLEDQTCLWFIEDASVTVGHASYNQTAGPGWLQVGTGKSWEVESDDILYKAQYKLIIEYNDTESYSATVEIKKFEANYDFSISQTAVGKDIYLSTQYDDTVSYKWYFKTADGTYQYIGNDSQVKVNDYLIYTEIEFSVEIKENSGLERKICTLYKTIYSPQNKDDVNVTFSGRELFQYDTNGDIPIEDIEDEYVLKPSIEWEDGFGTAYTLSWYLSDNTKLSTTPANPSSSMMRNIYIDDEANVHYSIQPKFNNNYTNNELTLVITSVDNLNYYFEKAISFMKDGDQGTNGTTYACVVCPCDEDGNKLSGFYPVFWNGTALTDWDYKAYTYKDGQLIDDDEDYSLSYSWSGENVTIQANDDRVSVSSISPIRKYFIIKLTVTILNNKDGSSTVIYSNYPLAVVFDDEVTDAETERLKYEVSVPTSVRYTSSGHSATYADLPLECKYNSESYGLNFSTNNDELINLKKINNVYYIRPVEKFNYDQATGSVSCDIDDKEVLFTIMMYLNTYGNEAINGWDGTKLQIDNEGKFILSPQVGAGTKNADNTFTGVLMGEESYDDQTLYGLYGYQDGQSSFGLTIEGKAYFGKAGSGRIEIDGTSGVIEGGGGGSSENGMTIKLSSNDGTEKAIQIGGDNFYVDYNGNMYATSGSIAGWKATKKALMSESENVALWSQDQDEATTAAGSDAKTDWRIKVQDKFGVDDNGNLYANSGKLANWTIEQDLLGTYKNNKLETFLASADTSGTISGWGTYGDLRLKIGDQFGVTSAGVAYCNRIKANGGTIAGWTINETSIYNDNTSFNFDAGGHTRLNARAGGKTTLSSSGSEYDVDTDNLRATGGVVGGCSLANNHLTVADANITSLHVDKLTFDESTIGWRSIKVLTGIESLKASLTVYTNSFSIPTEIVNGRATSWVEGVTVCKGWAKDGIKITYKYNTIDKLLGAVGTEQEGSTGETG